MALSKEKATLGGTAFLIGQQHILTTIDKDMFKKNADGKETEDLDDEFKNRTKVVFDYAIKDPNKNYTHVPKNNLYRIEKIVDRCRNGHWILLALDREVQGRFPLDFDWNKTKVDDEIYALGHPSGLPLKISVKGKIQTCEPASEFIQTNLIHFIENSGSPVFSSTSKKVIGILSTQSDVNFKGRCLKIDRLFYLSYFCHIEQNSCLVKPVSPPATNQLLQFLESLRERKVSEVQINGLLKTEISNMLRMIKPTHEKFYTEVSKYCIEVEDIHEESGLKIYFKKIKLDLPIIISVGRFFHAL